MQLTITPYSRPVFNPVAKGKFIDYSPTPQMQIIKHYQEILEKKLSSSPVLTENERIKDEMAKILYDYNYRDWEKIGTRLNDELKEMTDAKIQLLDAYINSRDMQKIYGIKKNIGSLVRWIKTKEESDFVIEVLEDKEGKYKATRENYNEYFYSFYYRLSAYMWSRNIPVTLKRKILQEPLLDKVLHRETVNKILGQKRTNLEAFNTICDILLKNKSVTKNLDAMFYFALAEAFTSLNPVQYIERFLKQEAKRMNG